jgi:hypothetical protein
MIAWSSTAPQASPLRALGWSSCLKQRRRQKDEGDFAAVLPHLGQERRQWLSEALELIHPGHHWLAELH